MSCTCTRAHWVLGFANTSASDAWLHCSPHLHRQLTWSAALLSYLATYSIIVKHAGITSDMCPFPAMSLLKEVVTSSSLSVLSRHENEPFSAKFQFQLKTKNLIPVALFLFLWLESSLLCFSFSSHKGFNKREARPWRVKAAEAGGRPMSALQMPFTFSYSTGFLMFFMSARTRFL